MNIIEQVKELREFEIGWLHDVPMAKSIMNQAADTIESLSAKLQAANMERSEDCGGWIACRNKPQRKRDEPSRPVLVRYKDETAPPRCLHLQFFNWEICVY